MAKYLYHLTGKENIPGILNSGLIPKIGERSKSAGEEEPFVFLCKKKDLPYWMILTGQEAAVRVSKQDLNHAGIRLTSYEWDGYTEYSTKDTIPAQLIQPYRLGRVDTADAMQDLCISFLYTMSSACTLWARIHADRYTADYLPDSLAGTLRSCRIGLSKLDYKCLPAKVIRHELELAGLNGSYTFCDRYNCTERRLWEILADDPDGILYEERRWLHDYIMQTFSRPRLKHPLLETETGGWC